MVRRPQFLQKTDRHLETDLEMQWEGGPLAPRDASSAALPRDSLSYRGGCFCMCSQQDVGRYVTDSWNDDRFSYTALICAASYPGSSYTTRLNSMYMLCYLSRLSTQSYSVNNNMIAGSGSPLVPIHTK